MTVAGSKYSKVQVYNKGDDDLESELAEYCRDMTEEQVDMALLKNMSHYKLKIKTI